MAKKVKINEKESKLGVEVDRVFESKRHLLGFRQEKRKIDRRSLLREQKSSLQRCRLCSESARFSRGKERKDYGIPSGERQPENHERAAETVQKRIYVSFRVKSRVEIHPGARFASSVTGRNAKKQKKAGKKESKFIFARVAEGLFYRRNQKHSIYRGGLAGERITAPRRRTAQLPVATPGGCALSAAPASRRPISRRTRELRAERN